MQRSHGFSAHEINDIEKLVIQRRQQLLKSWHGFSVTDSHVALATNVVMNDDVLCVELSDGRTVSAPIAWYPRLAHGTVEERSYWKLNGGGCGAHWPNLDEDVSVENLLAGKPSGESQASFKKWFATRS